MSIKTLVINPGSTSTKVGVFEDETLLFEETLRHPTEEIAKYASVIDQKDFRKEIILDFLKEKNCDPKTLNVIVGRGGLLKPIPGGTYAVSDALLADLKAGVQGQHASNLGGILAREIGDSLGVPSCIVLDTCKGKGATFAEPKHDHSSQPSEEQWAEAIAASEKALKAIENA